MDPTSMSDMAVGRGRDLVSGQVSLELVGKSDFFLWVRCILL